ncbi:MAG: aminotransferase class V-fold PLP-dependent enzyme, partial [Sphaerochaetaceae bacterium]|nr:aminotransferase class V-fold PLP-dependent enzyme [Sphaerochaetaceae bacterium]
MKTIYLDNNATTQMAPEVIEIMQESYALYGNASSMHSLGRESMVAIEAARSSVARMIGADGAEIIFTSGGSESDNTVLMLARDMIDEGSKRHRIVTSTIEHPASIETCQYLDKKGYHIDYVNVDASGRIDSDSFAQLM